MLLSVSAGISSLFQFLTVLLIFIFVLGITYFTSIYIAGLEKNRMITGNMELIEALRISGNKYLQIVKVGNRYLCIAVCKDTVTMLAELEKEDIKEIKSGNTQINFQTIFDKVRKKSGFVEKETNEENRP